MKCPVHFELENLIAKECSKYLTEHTYIPHIWHVPEGYRYIHIDTSCKTGAKGVYYCIDDSSDYVQLIFRDIFASERFYYLRRSLKQMTSDNSMIKWNEKGTICFYDEVPNNMHDVIDIFNKFINIINPILSSSYVRPYYEEDDIQIRQVKRFDFPKSENTLLIDNSQSVSLYSLSLQDVLSLRIRIPEYQRIYCWAKKNVIRLLNDITATIEKKREYRLGCIILQRKLEIDDKGLNICGEYYYDIIDGQQRLTTLAILLHALGVDGIGLLDESFRSSESNSYVAYNKHIINTYLEGIVSINENEIKDLLFNLSFSVLILNDDNIELAYTFFSNQNSKGRTLSDFDLLKAHHLRFIPREDEKLQMEKAVRWNDMILNKDGIGYGIPHERTLDKYLFRLRKWISMETWDENEPYRIKSEYEASPTFDDMPVSNSIIENCPYFEAIRGGEYFFNYVDHFVSTYKSFIEQPEFRLLNYYLSGSSHWHYRDVIEAFVFGYYLKFGPQYLTEATILISRLVSYERLNGRKADFDSLLKNAGDLRVAQMIEFSGTPSIFLKWLANEVLTKKYITGNHNVQEDYKKQLINLLVDLGQMANICSIKKFTIV